MRSRKRLLWILLGCAAIALLASASLPPRREKDLAFLSHFRYTVKEDATEDGSSDYRIFGDRAAIVAAIPGAASAKPDVSPTAVQYSFFLPSGRFAILTFSSSHPERHCLLMVEGKPTAWWYRALRRFHLI